MTEYLTPAGFGAGEYDEKRSRFLGKLWPVSTEEEARARIEETKKQYHDARHNCFCYLLRDGTVRYGDDGEPQGTAGQPMLALFEGEGVTDLCCVVTRYFGGVLLGTGGLARAYAAAAKAALQDAGLERMALWRALRIPCPYPRYESVRRLLESHDAVIEDAEFGAEVTLRALLREDRAAAFLEELRERSSGTLRAEDLGGCFRGVRVR